MKKRCITLQKKGEHEFEVIDGQQRLVTFSFVVLAAMKKIQDFVDDGIEVDENKKRLSVLKERLIGSTNPVTLKMEVSLQNLLKTLRHECYLQKL